jgi:hypothetical protein
MAWLAVRSWSPAAWTMEAQPERRFRRHCERRAAIHSPHGDRWIAALRSQ